MEIKVNDRMNLDIRGLSSIIRERFGNGEELIDFFCAVFHGDSMIPGVSVTLADIMAAAEWLAAYGYGKPVQPIEAVVTAATVDFCELLKNQSEVKQDGS